MRLDHLTEKQKLILQLGVATVIALILQFIVPRAWLPFQQTVGEVFSAEGGLLIAELSTWFFSLSIAWFINQNNKYLNSVMIYALLPLGVILALEFSFYFLFWDYLHLLPFIIGIYIAVKRRATLSQAWMLIFSLLLTGWVFLAYFLELAYSNMSILLLLLGMIIYIPVMIGVSFFLRITEPVKKGVLKKIMKGFLVGLWVFGVFLGSVLLYWYLRPNTAEVNKAIVVDSWLAVTGQHNSNTDLIYWNQTEMYYLIHDRRPFHLGSTDARLILWNSTDARTWTKVTEFSVPGNDIRDPKFVVIGSRLFMYALKNVGVIATPYQTIYTSTENGSYWESFQDIAHAGWLFWRPKTNDNATWYVPAYWHEHGESILLNSTDGINWNIISTIWVGEGNDETAIEFLPDGRMICTARLEGTADTLFGSSNASTLIATSAYPFIDWTSHIKSRVTRLDGPVLFSYNEKTYAIARYQIGPRTFFTELGSVFSGKRTSIFLVNETTGLTRLTDLPSAGDTSYAGVVKNGTELIVSYYTSDITKDYSWLLGMVSDSDIRMAKIDLTALNALAEVIG